MEHLVKELDEQKLSNASMHRIQINNYGGPEVLEYAEAPIPQPGEGQVLIRMRAAGVNPADWKNRSGYMKQNRPLTFPWTPGLDGAGVIEALGPGVTQFKRGQSVFGIISGPYAEYAVASTADLQIKPDILSFEEAASIPVGALTAWGAAIDVANVQAGQSVLVQGAAGGVGLFAVQLALLKGAKMYGTASPSNMEFVRSLGAEPVDYTAEPFEEKLRNLDVVIDTVGGEVTQRSLSVLRQGGILVSVAGRLPEDAGKNQGVRVSWAGRTSTARLADIVRLIEQGKLKPAVYRVFDLPEARQAHELSETRHGRGRIVLRMTV